MKLALEKRYGIQVLENHHLLPWMNICAALLYNICAVRDHERTVWEKRRGKQLHEEVPEFGECILHLRLESVGIDKLDTRWGEGISCGMKIESGEIIVMTSDGVIAVRFCKRRPEQERWELDQMNGVNR